MDLMTIASTTATTTMSGGTLSIVQPTKSPEEESETPPRIQPAKPISFTNGVLKRHAHAHHQHHAPVNYKECLKNHAASLGGHALDGCGEFMPAPTATASDPTSLKCAACGCHRNFHRRETETETETEDPPATTTTHVLEFHPQHRHHPLPPPPPQPQSNQTGRRSPGSASPPPISSSYAPHMLLALSGGAQNNTGGPHPLNTNLSRKRFRTKFNQDQKEKMYEFAEKVGWKLQRSNEEMVNGFCNEIGVERGVFKVWMHNNKNSFAKRSANLTVGQEIDHGNGHSSSVSHSHQHLQDLGLGHQYNGKSTTESNAPTNASSSSS